ncbi:Retrovirus-related Pol polyprotein from transposon TNT 1-94 [Vitis vinifera]|uniref:Retrovirus-related Pol polyprotein from transposon TNT 1-94 n=1 Tax=Vitis vinifera TaxID=29760 RepID=A0A438IZU7_VITVI|nr:Retrovirus-related Pol polyprotein from transposon TNT 1-94 [Vitis vinifera]
MAEEAGKASGIEKFDGTDFAYWRMQIEDYLYGRKLHLPLLGTKPESMKAKEWPLLDRQVLGVIRLTLSRSVTHNVVKEKTTADLMKALSDSCSGRLDFFAKQLGGNEDAVSNSTGKEKLKYNDIRDLILAEEIRRRDASETSGSGSALNLETRGRGNNRNSNQGRSNSRNSNRNRSKSRSGQQVQCWNCGKTGHFKRQCKSPKKKNEDDSANAITEEVQDALLLAVDSPLDDWVLDSGASLGCCGSGRRPISLPNGSVWLLEKVRHIPDLKRNLISVGQLDDEGHAILFVGGTWKVTKGARVLARGKKTALWMKMLLSKGKLPELKSIDFDMCESCILGKQKKVSFLKTGKTPKAEKLELVYTDLWGPSPVASLGGSRYYITFIDDSSRKVWVYFLKNKSDVIVTFKKWKVMVETETGLKVKCLRSDNGGEYIDGGFSEYCAAQGIRMEKTIPGTPQQNGVAERMNRTLNERARSMRLHVGLPKTFWADAVSTAAYLINRGPSVPMEFRLPEEVMYKDRSTVTSDVTEIDQKKSEFVNLDELTESTVQKGGEEDKENVNSQVDLSTPVAEVRKSSRNIRPPQHYSPVLNYLLLTDGGEPECYDEALQDENSSKWKLAMKDEMDSLLGNQTWELTELPVGKKALHNKWVYRIKNEHNGSKRYKARLVVKGFQQKKGIDYTEIFSPVVKMSTIRLVLGMVAAENLHLEQLDVKTAFLHGDLEEDLYMIQPEGFIVQGQENLVCKLRKILYDLKQAPRQWYKKFDNFMHRIGFKRCEADHCYYFKSFDNSYIILLLYVDDMLIAGSDIEKINNLKKQLSKQFAMKDLGAAKQILGMRIIRDKANGTLKLS